MTGREFCNLRNKAAATNTAIDKAFCMKLRISGFYCISRYPKGLRKAPRSGEWFAATKNSIDNQLPDRSLYACV
ncbi:hypothetical protein D3C80_1077870 [compost metagenome]